MATASLVALSSLTALWGLAFVLGHKAHDKPLALEGQLPDLTPVP